LTTIVFSRQPPSGASEVWESATGADGSRFVFLSADEMLSLHEFMGYELEQATGIVKDTTLDQRGYSWVLLYAPAAIVVAGFLFGFYRRMTKEIKAARVCFMLAWVAIGLVVLGEIADGLSILERVDMSLEPCIEESMELVGLDF